jgi:hypothetical protein
MAMSKEFRVMAALGKQDVSHMSEAVLFVFNESVATPNLSSEVSVLAPALN